MLNRLIQDCNNEILEHKKGKRDYPHWKDLILLPLARELGMRMNTSYSVAGVFGLRFQCYITVGTHSLSITPVFKADGTIKSLNCDTDVDTMPCNMNGLGIVTKPLPDSIDEIKEILFTYGQ